VARLDHPPLLHEKANFAARVDLEKGAASRFQPCHHHPLLAQEGGAAHLVGGDERLGGEVAGPHVLGQRELDQPVEKVHLSPPPKAWRCSPGSAAAGPPARRQAPGPFPPPRRAPGRGSARWRDAPAASRARRRASPPPCAAWPRAPRG